MTEISVRHAKTADGARIAEIFTASRRLMPYLPHLHTPEEQADFICNTVLVDTCVYVALIDQRIAGFLAGKGNWIDHLYVHPQSLRRGVGSRLLNEVKNRAEELTLWTFRQNAHARLFYEKQGFRAVEWTNGAGNMEKLPDVRYLWSKRVQP